jgi:N-methylhydantoinase A/oxoprolinase/acetone carboxylase beta subunit
MKRVISARAGYQLAGCVMFDSVGTSVVIAMLSNWVTSRVSNIVALGCPQVAVPGIRMAFKAT